MSEMDRAYYVRGGIEAIDVVDAWGLGFELGNVVKYLARAGHKHPDRLEDLKKARWYLDREIARSVDPVAEVERMRGTRPSGRVPADDVTPESERPECLSPQVGYWRPKGMEGGSFMSAPSGGAAGQPAKAPHGRHLGPCPDNT
jgi:hypothetical protein